VLGNDGKSFATKPLVRYKIDTHTAHVVQQPLLHNDIKTRFLLNGIVLGWLIQSQAQTGPASAMARNVNPNRLFFLCFI
jgi:hypothetical protein